MKFRRHHNNKGQHQVRKGWCAEQVKRIAKKLGLKYEVQSQTVEENTHEERKLP